MVKGIFRVLLVSLPVLFILGVLLTSLTAAQASPSWGNYNALTNWALTQNEHTEDCGSGTPIHTDPVTVKFAASKVTITTNNPAISGALEGIVSGYKFDFTGGTYTESGGIVNIINSNVDLSADCSSFKGTDGWTYKKGGFSCKGTTDISGERTDGAGCPMPAEPKVVETQNVTTPVKAEAKPQSNNWFSKILILVILIAIAAVGYYLYKKFSKKE